MRLKAYIFMALVLSPYWAIGEEKELSYSEYRAKLSKAEQEADYRKRILKSNELHLLVPEKKVTPGPRPAGLDVTDQTSFPHRPEKVTPAAEGLPGTVTHEDRSHGKAQLGDQVLPIEKSGKMREDLTEKISISPQGDEEKRKKKHKSGMRKKAGYRYLPPSARKGNARVVALNLSGEDFKSISRVFGIPLGEKIKVKLDATVSSIQPGFVTLTVLEDVAGDKRILRRGSKLFGRPSAIKGTSRLFVRLSKGITPEHIEFQIKGTVSDEHNEAGLVGSIISDGKLIDRSLDAGVLALGSAAASMLPGDVATNAAQTAADTAINEKRKESAARLGTPAFIVVAKPQTAYVHIEETF